MTTGNTTLLGLALPVEGELDGTWGDVVNDSLTSLVDSAVAGTTTLSADADVTLTDTALAANQARQAVILWTASNGASTRNITAPARSKPYIVINAGTGSIVLRGAGPTTGVTIVAGEKCLAAWNGSDFVKVAVGTGGNNTFTGTQTFAGTTSRLAEVLTNAAEVVTVSATAATGTINFDVTSQSVLYYTSNAAANWTVNFRASSGASIDSVMSTGQSVTVAHLVTQGGTAYYNNAVNVDGSAVTPKYQGGIPWSAGNINSIDVYSYTIIKTGSAAFTVLTSQTQFA
jgi:hypothetical protein